MSELTRLRIELNNLKQQVKFLMTKDSSGSTPVKVKGLWDGNYFNTDNDEAPSVTSNTGDFGDIFVADVYKNGLWATPSSTVLVKRVPTSESRIKEDAIFFATKATKEVSGNNNILYYILEAGGNSSVPVKILNLVTPSGLEGDQYAYTAEIYENGVESGEPFTVGEVKQVDIGASETIPNGAWAMASKSANGIWYVQVPVWL